MYTKLFWKKAFENAVTTFLQFATVLIPANWMSLQIDWAQILLYCGIGFILAFAKAILAGLKNGTTSLIDAPLTPVTGKGRHSL